MEALNSECFCLSLNEAALARALDGELGETGLSDMIRERAPYLFASQPVFVAPQIMRRVAEVVQAVESVVALPGYREDALANAPAIARLGTRGARGAFFGYDFHLDHGRLGLIEINTNAGGAMLNAVQARAHRICCAAMGDLVPTTRAIERFELSIIDMFRSEWRLAGHTSALTTIAIVDDTPEQQYLYPEFLLFQRLFERHGLRAIIADPTDFEFRRGKLWHGDVAIEMIYNRLTDFYLESPGTSVLREAYAQRAIVLTPDPHAHALYADKRHLALFSDSAKLEALGVPAVERRILLDAVPKTEIVNPADAQRLWDARRGLFFKPMAGFGSRAAYRGDKLTKRVWQHILANDYVAQMLIPPGERRIGPPDDFKALKFDLRAYVYNGSVQWFAARLYQGQTTNFRTPGGGFAPVYSTVDTRSGESTINADPCGEGSSEEVKSFASYVFLLDVDGGVHPIPHALYLALAKGDASALELAGQTLRLADWYVRTRDGTPEAVENETYACLTFDAEGKIDRSTKSEANGPELTEESRALPTAGERARMNSLLFG